MQGTAGDAERHTYKWRSPVDSHQWTHQCWTTRKDLYSSVLWEHLVPTWVLAKSDGNLGQITKEGQENSYQELQINYIYIYIYIYIYSPPHTQNNNLLVKTVEMSKKKIFKMCSMNKNAEQYHNISFKK